MHEIHNTRVRDAAVAWARPSAVSIVSVVELEKEKGLMVQAIRAGAGLGGSAGVVLRNIDSLGSPPMGRN
ncbi:hypothetical protein PATSB16_13130 [Pandoraea thiooxydans]|uniref:hypothetical protein n=1 Tax=Pandoraea thiooxydans TaxID=445709 RepID=UPI00094A4DC6|nr:hypothetical protein [Pandoraea thiooxydans]APR94655.1 hypothetical protein PATSB16_13130 [Pandoraea thiooxydans]